LPCLRPFIHRGTIGETYCIGGNAERENIWIIKKLLALLGSDEGSIEYVQDRAGHDRRYAIDYAKIERELGWQPTVTLEEGLEKTVSWFQNNQDWWKNIKSGDYQQYYKEQYEKRQ
jgi:dTDP-glucose 4,6-dehydratase